MLTQLYTGSNNRFVGDFLMLQDTEIKVNIAILTIGQLDLVEDIHAYCRGVELDDL